MKSRRIWWSIYTVCAGTLLFALVWITITVVRLERAEWSARADARHQESMRLALWRLDSWLMPHLAREAGRPHFEYQPFYSQSLPYAATLQEVERADKLTPSPLLSFSSAYVQLHFQMSPTGILTSPQVPEGDMRLLAEDVHLSSAKIDTSAAALSHLGRILRAEKVVNCMAESESQSTVDAVEALLEGHVPPLAESTAKQTPEGLSRQEWAKRKGSFLQNLEVVSAKQGSVSYGGVSQMPAVDVGPLVPLWITAVEEQTVHVLVYIRRVRIRGLEYYQGFVCDWPLLRKSLLGEISDLFSNADLVPQGDSLAEGTAPGAMLATAPLMLRAGSQDTATFPSLGPVRVATTLTWVAVVAGLVAVALNLRQSIRFGERRSRFAAAVTHELRTPLTTFRLYTEMLALNMIKDPGQRQEYLEALKDESGRLASLVENVLAYAQLEEGKRTRSQSRVSVAEVIKRLRPPLERRAIDSGMDLQVRDATSPDTEIDTDVDAVGQILYNLVDNACKYAQAATDRTLQLEFARKGDRLRVTVSDHGPGISPEHARMVFVPFERGRELTGNQQGLGLGLALSRRLARDLGGDLALLRGYEAGAFFVMELPMPD